MLILIAQASEKAAEAASAGGIGAIGIDARSLVLQIINFAILLLLLKKFAYKPIVDILEQRQRKVEESLKTAQEIEAAKVALEKEKENIIKETHAKAQNILEQSRKQAAEIISATEQTATARDKQLMESTNAKIGQEVEKVRVELLQSMGNFVSQATEKVLGHKLNHETDSKIISDAIRSSEDSKNE